MVVPVGVIVIAHLMLLPNRRREVIALSVGIVGSMLLAQTAFRYLYYGDILPNTYYLKMTGYPAFLRIERGLAVLWSFVASMLILPILLPYVMTRFRQNREQLLLLGLFSIQLIYSVYVGGDVWEWWGGSNRFISVAMPLFFLAYSIALYRLVVHMTPKRHGKKSKPPAQKDRFLMLAFLVISILLFNMLQGPSSLREWALLGPPLHVEDNENIVRRALLVKRYTVPEATIAVTWAGGLPYFSDRATIDLLGKTDHFIAHGPVAPRHPRRPFGEFLPGHMKWDYSYSLGQLKPDLIVQFWGHASLAAKWLKSDYHVARVSQFVFCFRKGADTIIWDRVPAAMQGTDG